MFCFILFSIFMYFLFSQLLCIKVRNLKPMLYAHLTIYLYFIFTKEHPKLDITMED